MKRIEVYKKIHPNMTREELRQICNDMIISSRNGATERYLEDKNKEIEILFGKNEIERFYRDSSFVQDHVNAFFDSRYNIMGINEVYIKNVIENDRVGLFLATIDHEIEHFLQSIGEPFYDKEEKEIFKKEAEYYTTPIYDKKFEYEQVFKMLPLENGEQNSSEIKLNEMFQKFYSDIYALYSRKIYSENSKEIWSNILPSFFTYKGLRDYALSSNVNEEQKEWFTKQSMDILDNFTENASEYEYLNRVVKNIDKNLIKNNILFFLNNATAVDYKTSLNFIKMCSEINLIDNEFKTDCERFLLFKKHISNNEYETYEDYEVCLNGMQNITNKHYTNMTQSQSQEVIEKTLIPLESYLLNSIDFPYFCKTGKQTSNIILQFDVDIDNDIRREIQNELIEKYLLYGLEDVKDNNQSEVRKNTQLKTEEVKDNSQFEIEEEIELMK